MLFPALIRSRYTWYVIGFLLLVIAFGYLYLQNRNYKLQVRNLETLLSQYEKANAHLNQRYMEIYDELEKVQKVYKSAIAKYQKLLRECANRRRECKKVVVTNCPTFKIKEKDENDELLKALNSLFGD